MDATSKASNAGTRAGKVYAGSSLLPLTLESTRFAPGSNRSLPKLDSGPYRRTWTTDRYIVQKDQRAKQVLEFLSCRVRHVAPEVEVTMTERRQRENKIWDKLDAVVQRD